LTRPRPLETIQEKVLGRHSCTSSRAEISKIHLITQTGTEDN
jgi:hypothetical protein